MVTRWQWVSGFGVTWHRAPVSDSCLTLGNEVCHLCAWCLHHWNFKKMWFPISAHMCRPEKSCHRDSRYCPWPPWRSFLGFFLQKVKWTHTCHRWSSPPQWHQALLTRPTEVPTALQGKKGTRTLAKAERTQRWSCCNYFNLNLAMARAVNDTPLLGKKVLQGHFNDHKDLSCALKLKVATSRTQECGLGVGTDASCMGFAGPGVPWGDLSPSRQDQP